MGVLLAQGRLVHVVAGMGDLQGTAGLDHLHQHEALDMPHCQDEAVPPRRAEEAVTMRRFLARLHFSERSRAGP